MDKFNLVKNIRISVVSFAINIALVFISYRLVIVNDGIESVGLWSLLMAWGALVRVGDVGMGGAILRFISTKSLDVEPNEIRKFVDTGIIMNLMVFTLLTLVGYLILDSNLSSVVSADALQLAKTLLPIMFIGILLSTMTSVIIASLQGLHFGYLGSYLTVGGNLLQIVCVLLLVPKLGVLGLAWAQLIQYGSLSVLGWLLIGSKIGAGGYLPFSFSFSVLREMFSFSLKAQLANVTNGLFEPISKILISQFAGLQIQGFFELAYKTVSLTRNAIVAGLFASLPTLTNLFNTNPKQALSFYKKSQNNVTKAITLMMVLVILFSPVVSVVWVGQFEMDYWFFVVCVAIGFWLNTIGATAYNLGMATGRMRNNIVSAMLVLLVLLMLGYLLGYFLESKGVGVAVGLSLAFGGVLIKFLNEKLIFQKMKKA